MVKFKKLFGRGDSSAPPERELTVEDLITLERWEEAIELLQGKVKLNPRDFYSHLKLADTFLAAQKPAKALDAYLLVADLYSDDGFYDRAAALLSKISRLWPADTAIQARLAKLQRFKQLEHSRVLAVEGLITGQLGNDASQKLSPVEAQQVWQSVASSELVKRLGGEQLKRLFTGAALMVWEAGELVAERESTIARMFLVIKGQLEVVLALPDGRPIQLRTLQPGDIFGERALLEHLPWPATYRALERSRLLRIDRAGLERALQGNPDPRQLLDALRSQRHDHEVAAAAAKLLASPA